MSNKEIHVIDGTGLVAGRLASVIAKRLLNGEKIVVVNAEKIIIVGKPKSILERFKKRIVEWKTYYNPEKRGPKYPRRPDLIFKRMVRGMLPYKKPKGREAYRRLRVYIGIPDEFKNHKFENVPQAIRKNIKVPYISLGEVYKHFGGKL